MKRSLTRQTTTYLPRVIKTYFKIMVQPSVSTQTYDVMSNLQANIESSHLDKVITCVVKITSDTMHFLLQMFYLRMEIILMVYVMPRELGEVGCRGNGKLYKIRITGK